MKRLLIIIASLDRHGGAEKTAAALSSLSKDFDIHYLTFYRCDEEYGVTQSKYCLDESPDSRLIGQLGKLFKRAWEIRRFCHKEQIDVCLSFMEESNLPLILSRILFGNRARVWVSIRNNLRAKYHSLYVALLSFFYLWAHGIVGVSRYIVDQLAFQSLLRPKYSTVYNFVGLHEIEKKAKEKNQDYPTERNQGVKFITVGRLHPQKNHMLLVDSFAKTKNTDLTVIGEGKLRSELEERVRINQLGERVHLIGYRSNVYAYMAKADIFVLSSDYEGFANVLLEALACGLPVISTDCSFGAREILAPSLPRDEVLDDYRLCEFGILTPVGNRESFHRALEYLVTHPDIQRHYTQKSRIRARDFNYDAIVAEWKELLAHA